MKNKKNKVGSVKEEVNPEKEEPVKEEGTFPETQAKPKKTFKAIFQRYWYWPATIIVMGVIAVLWCYFMGYLGDRYKEKEAEIILQETEATVYLGMYYKIGAYAEGFAVTYGLGEGTAEVEVDSFGVVHAIKPGMRIVNVYAGKAQKSVLITVTELLLDWRIGIGDEITETDVENVIGSVYDMTKSFSFEIGGMDALETKEGEAGTYVAVEKGYELFYAYIENEFIGIVRVVVDEDIEEDDKIFFTNAITFPEEIDVSQNVRKTLEDRLVGETGKIDDFSFSSGGHIRFISSKPETVRVYQDGTYKIYRPGTAVITVLCVSSDGYEFYNFRLRTPVEEVKFYVREGEGDESTQRYLRVGEELTLDDLYTHFWIDGLEVISAEEYASFFSYDEEGQTYKALRSTNGDTVYLGGYTEDGILLVRYAIVIEEAE